MLQRVLLFAFLFFPGLQLHSQPKQNTPVKKTVEKVKVKERDDTAICLSRCDSIVAFSKKYIGVKYCYGGEDAKKGFDCAGFVMFVYRHFGIKLPRTADAQGLLGTHVKRKDAMPGDLIFFKGSNRKNKAIGHSGIVVDNKDGKIKFISSTLNAGIHIDDLDEAYWKDRFISIKRIVPETGKEKSKD
jgi:hypothetical protein